MIGDHCFQQRAQIFFNIPKPDTSERQSDEYVFVIMIISTFFVAAFKVAHSISWLRPFAHFSSHIGQPHSGHLWTWLCFYVLNWIYSNWDILQNIYWICSNWDIFQNKRTHTCSCHQQVSGTANNILMKSGNDFSFKPRVG